MKRAKRQGRGTAAGFTYLELLVVLALMSLMASAAVPVVWHRYKLHQELELKRALTEIRNAIDLYHEYAVKGQIQPWDIDWNMYPKDFDELVDGVDVKPAQDQKPVKVKFLRAIPIDPMTGEAQWDCRGYKDDPDERSSSCDDLFDVSSQSQDLSADGTTRYSEW